MTLPDLGTLPEAWLSDLEKAAICGYDRLVLELVIQLPPEFAQLAAHFAELASQFRFEDILDVVQNFPSPDFLPYLLQSF
jgi:hypothetical protein